MANVKELFYGGARGGGKTDFLLVDFLRGVNEYGENWKGIFFRQTVSQLEQPIARAKQIYLSLGAEYHKAENYFSFPNGARINFRYLEQDSDCENYQGHNYTWIGFDELGNYRTDYAWVTMMMCLRSAVVPENFLRMRGTGNPGGVGHNWLKQRFVEGREPVVVYQEPIGKTASGETLSISRAFVPATLNDNTALMQNNPSYKINLMAQPLRVRQAMLEGRWDIKGGGEFFDMFDETVHVLKPRILTGHWHRYYALDWGYKSPYAVIKLAVNKDGKTIVYGEMYGQGTVEGVEKENVGSKESSIEVAAKVAADMAKEGVSELVADNSCWDENDYGGTIIDPFLQLGIQCEKSIKNKKTGWQKVINLLQEKDESGAPYLRIFSTCKYLLREMENIQCDKNDLETPDTKMPDHALDALRYALMSPLYGFSAEYVDPIDSERAQPKPYNPLDHGYWAKHSHF